METDSHSEASCSFDQWLILRSMANGEQMFKQMFKKSCILLGCGCVVLVIADVSRRAFNQSLKAKDQVLG